MMRVFFESESLVAILAIIRGVRFDLGEEALSEMEISGIDFRFTNLWDFMNTIDETNLSSMKPATQKSMSFNILWGYSTWNSICADVPE